MEKRQIVFSFAQATNRVQMTHTTVVCLYMEALLPAGGWVSHYRIYIRNLFLESVIYCKQ